MIKFHTLFTAIVLGVVSFVAFSQEHDHHANDTNSHLVLNQGEKWRIDESLHIGLSRIKILLEVNLDDIHYERFTAEQFAEFAKNIDQQLSFLFEHCQLPPKADTQLHILLSKVMQGVAKIKNASDKKSGAILILQALNDYPVYFNDPNWQPIAH